MNDMYRHAGLMLHVFVVTQLLCLAVAVRWGAVGRIDRLLLGIAFWLLNIALVGLIWEPDNFNVLWTYLASVAFLLGDFSLVYGAGIFFNQHRAN